MVAKVKWFDAAKGWGFARMKDGQEVFLHFSNILGNGFKTLNVDQEIEFDLYEAEGVKERRRLFARNIKVKKGGRQ